MVDASHVPEPTRAKSLADRVAYANPQRSVKSDPLTKTSANPKAQPKSATNVKKATAKDGTKGRSAGKPGSKPAKRDSRRQQNRPKAKTAEELDAEMTDYWGGNNPAAAAAPIPTPSNGNAVAAPAGGDDAMDEISVSDFELIC